MSAETLVEQLDSLELEERERFFQILEHRITEVTDVEEFMTYWDSVAKNTKKWYTMEDLERVMKESEGKNDSL